MKLVILDRDNTLIRVPTGRRYLYADDEIQFVDGAVDFLRSLHAARVHVAIATNQQGVSLPEFPEMTLASVDGFHSRLQAELSRHDAPIDRIYVCPHAAAANCRCRKPQPGLLLQAMVDFGVGPEQTAVIGDQWRDLEAARAAGIRSLFWLQRDQTEPSGDDTPSDGITIIAAFRDCLGPILGGYTESG